MIVKDNEGNTLLEMINVDEEQAEKLYCPVNHSLIIVKVGDDYLMGWNHFRKEWEIFGGCKDDGETIRECAIREGFEEAGLEDIEYNYLGLMHYKMAPGYFDPTWHEEYGGLYGVTVSRDRLKEIEKHRSDKKEVEKLAFYSEIKDKERISVIDEKLLEYWE